MRKLVRTGLPALVVAVGALLGVMLIRTALYVPAATPAEPIVTVAIPEGAAGRLAGALRIPTVSPEEPGDFAAESFLALHAHLQSSFPRAHAQLRREVVAGYSLLYTWPGSDPSLKPILLLGHLDVVPAGAGWREEPFGGRIADGFVWGRGAIDNKASVVGILEAVELLLAEGFRPARTIHFAFGHDEEAGGTAGAREIAALLRSRGVGLELILDEGGIVADGILPGVAAPVALVGIAEKGFVSVELSVRAPGGHSSLPPPQSAVGILAAAVARLERNPMESRFDGATRRLFERIGPELPFGQRFVLANLWLTRPLVTSGLEANPATRAMIRTTGAVTLIQGGTKDNVLPTRARAVANFRILPGDRVADVVEHVRHVVADPRVEVGIGGRFSSEPSPVSSAESEGFRAIERAIRQVFPGVRVAPFQVVVATDSRHYRDLGADVFRFQPLRLTSADLERMHGVDERVQVTAYEDAVRFYRRLLIEGAGSGSTVRKTPDGRQPGRKEVPMDQGTMQKGHAHHAGHAEAAADGMLMVRTEPRAARSGEPTILRMMIHGADGSMVKDFETVHEAKVHLIVVRDGLDPFAHLHPEVDAVGNLKVEYRFPVGGKYRLYADYRPAGQASSVAKAELEVGGSGAPAPRLVPDVPGRIRGSELEAEVELANPAVGTPVRITFRLQDAASRPILDLQPYLGALGHLVVISADGGEYVHAHPAEGQAGSGRVGFEASFSKPGIYKAWGQFRRGGRIHTLPLVLRIG